MMKEANSPKNKKIIWVAMFLLGLSVGIGIGWFSERSRAEEEIIKNRGSILRDKDYSFINPILACEIGQKDSFPEFKPIEEKLNALVLEQLKTKNASNISFYIRTLNSGRWIAMNEEEKYAPASLLKVIIMMAYLKTGELDQGLLSKSLTYREAIPESRTAEGAPSEETTLKIGNRYTIEELIEAMIINSDNAALYLLINNMDEETHRSLADIYSDLNIPLPQSGDLGDLDFLSVKTYSILFRVLYGSTYLNREVSEKALKMLSQATFNEGLVAGLPSHIKVAHKFGARTESDAVKELHDCGIVYYPSHPYLLCVMTRGGHFSNLKTTIAAISKKTYEELDNYWKSRN